MNELDQEKAFYERFFALHRDPQLVEVVKTFGIGVFRRSSVLEGFAEFIKANGFGGRRCVEIGTCNGLTALVLARHFDEVVTIDIAPNEVKRRIAHHCQARNIRFVDIADNAEKAHLIGGLEFDAAYVDGDHAHDTETDFALVQRSGRVLFHECWEAQPPVFNLVNRLKESGSVITKGKLALWTA
jgi:protein-L-isoaspartate O-methyltransferase